MTQLKTCRTCRADKPNTLEFFRAHKSCKDGIDTQCRSCATAYQQDWRTKNRVRHLANRRALYAKGGRAKEVARQIVRIEIDPIRQAAITLAGGVRDRVKKLGLPSSATMLRTETFEQWLKHQPNCACCGVPFDIGPKDGKPNDASPSVDRFDPSTGYTIVNSSLICWRCNNIKRNYTADDLRLVAAWMDAHAKFNPQEIAA